MTPHKIEELVERGLSGKVPTPELGVTLSHRPMSSDEWRAFGIEAAQTIKTLMRALEDIAERAKALRKGTDDWFELVEFETIARQALSKESGDA